ncbi:lipid-A-disaccharide synthase [Rufibacter quisquiliarum]|uniref:Lipid-A-disaccharide synthase n=1 Tax=Rufibacter quisquiliarum TaxID=1549639 RepID=A0A839GK46_9BACT|nr:lipid-A-disaccharide synthase [Rufibacter quisquiliarum]MBA9079030.1 lipid-A-disaccharide synthase [Rufibacter quisquiliarum]
MKYYIIAGERSGDLHASNLIKKLHQEDPQAHIRCWGGDMMEAAGAQLVKHYQEMAFMGFLEAATNLLKIKRFLKECQQDLLQYQPDVVILVDYAGFNMRIAKFAKANGLKVFYYISPKIWAWNQGRVHTIKKLVDRMFVIMPFEKDFYQKFDYHQTDYIGNPVSDSVSAHVVNKNFRKENGLDDRPIIAVLPGSRQQEIENILYIMLSILPPFQDYQFVVAAVSNFSKEYYEHFNREPFIKIVYDQTYDLLAHAEVALVTSGTATLETALFNVPQVVCYRTSNISYWIGKAVIKVPYISLVNLIANERVVPELIQSDLNAQNLVKELKNVLENPAGRDAQLKGYAKVRKLIGDFNTSETAAKLMVQYLKEEKSK